MPRLVKKIPSYRHHRPSGRALVCLNGKRIYLGKWDTPESRERYRQVIAEWLADGKLPGDDQSFQDLRIVELLAKYWTHAERYYCKNGKPTKEIPCIRESLRPLQVLYGRTIVSSFGPTALKGVRQTMIDSGWARSTINNRIMRIKRMFKWATENELVPPSVFHAVCSVAGLRRGRSKAKETEPVSPVAEEYVDAIAPFVSRQVWAMVQLQVLSGMRPGEAVTMRGCVLDTSGQIWTYTPQEHKTEHHGHVRTIYLGPRAQGVVAPFLRRHLTAYLFSPIEAEQERLAARTRARRTPLHVGNRPGSNPKANRRRNQREHYDVASYRKAIQRACTRAFPPPEGLSVDEMKLWRREHRWHPHQLRHNAATTLRREFGIEVARIVLGHRSVSVTEVYAEIDVAKAQEAMSKIG
ncbi:MAG: site-specific integrase [Phycisphaerae bacterium]|nr:site-specific integrase [Phycisphaerae bacterium]